MAKIIIDKSIFVPIVETQRIEFCTSLQKQEKNGMFEIPYNDRNYKCMPYLEPVLQSKIQGLSFFSGGGGLDIGAQMAGIKVLTSLDFEKDAVATLKANKFFAHTEHRLDDIRNVKASDFDKIFKD